MTGLLCDRPIQCQAARAIAYAITGVCFFIAFRLERIRIEAQCLSIGIRYSKDKRLFVGCCNILCFSLSQATTHVSIHQRVISIATVCSRRPTGEAMPGKSPDLLPPAPHDGYQGLTDDRRGGGGERHRHIRRHEPVRIRVWRRGVEWKQDVVRVIAPRGRHRVGIEVPEPKTRCGSRPMAGGRGDCSYLGGRLLDVRAFKQATVSCQA